MTNSNKNDKPTQPPAIAPLSSEWGRVHQRQINESDLRKSVDRGQNTIRNTHPAPGNPNRDNSGGNKDSK